MIRQRFRLSECELDVCRQDRSQIPPTRAQIFVKLRVPCTSVAIARDIGKPIYAVLHLLHSLRREGVVELADIAGVKKWRII